MIITWGSLELFMGVVQIMYGRGLEWSVYDVPFLTTPTNNSKPRTLYDVQCTPLDMCVDHWTYFTWFVGVFAYFYFAQSCTDV